MYNDDQTRWVDTMLERYGDMLTVREVASILAVEERTVRELLAFADPAKRLPGIKLTNFWRIAKVELRQYLLMNRNGSTAGTIRPPGGQ